MNDVWRDLYQELIMDHHKRPRHHRVMDDPTHTGCGHNPLCGDQVTVFLRIHQDVIEDVSFQGQGCAISMASASMMTEALHGTNLQHAQQLQQQLHQVLVQGAEPSADLGKLQVLAGVRAYPMRVKCATLAWHTWQSAYTASNQAACTE